MRTDTIVQRLLNRGESTPNNPALVHKVNGSWETITWKEYATLVQKCARAFMSLGLEVGDVVTVLSDNNVPWVVSDVGAMAAGGVATGIYQSCTAEQVGYIIGHASAPICVVQNEAQLGKIMAAKGDLPDLKWVILISGDVPEEARPWALTWEALLEKADQTSEEALNARLDGLESAQLGTLIYTSGTTGNPKGVMLSHHNLTWTADSLGEACPGFGDGVGLSYLPLSHIAEQLLTIHVPISMNITIWFAESLEKLKENLPEARPTTFFGVPRVWEKFQAALGQRFNEATGVKAALVGFSRKTCTEVNRLRETGREPGGLLGLKYAIASKLVISKLKGALGLDHCNMFISGAAPISKDTLEFFRSLDIDIWEVYGQSEGSGPTTLNRPNAHRLGAVGPPIPGCEVKIADDGEILVKGGNVFMGYYKNEEATAETLVDGWLYSGDVGEFDSDGFLRITDRKKDLIITAGGKNVAPQNLEGLIKGISEISQAVIIGDKRKYLTALLTLEEAAANRWADANGLGGASLTELAKQEKFQAYIQAQVDSINADLARYETVKKFVILPDDFSPETGELTPTMKVKRRIINQKYATQIESMY